MNTYIYLPPRGHRRAPRFLAKATGAQLISYEKQRPIALRPESCIINWGNSTLDREFSTNPPIRIYNKPENVDLCCSKIKSLTALHEADIPAVEFTTNYHEAEDWYLSGNVVYTRLFDRSSRGRGIIVRIPGEGENKGVFPFLPEAKLYTKRFKGKLEYRIHIFDGKIIQIQQKKKRKDADNKDFYVKNVANGYVFAIQNIDCPLFVQRACIQAVECLGLDFGAIDVGFAPTTGEFRIFEINTRPALMGTTMLKYIKVIQEL